MGLWAFRCHLMQTPADTEKTDIPAVCTLWPHSLDLFCHAAAVFWSENPFAVVEKDVTQLYCMTFTQKIYCFHKKTEGAAVIVLKADSRILLNDTMFNAELRLLWACFCVLVWPCMPVIFLFQKWTATITLCMFTTAAWCSCSEEISPRSTLSDPPSSTGNWSRWEVCVCVRVCMCVSLSVFYLSASIDLGWFSAAGEGLLLFVKVKIEAFHCNYRKPSITFFCSLHTHTRTRIDPNWKVCSGMDNSSPSSRCHASGVFLH